MRKKTDGHIMLDVLLDALLDTLKLAPILLIVHIIIEVLEEFGLTNRLQKTLKGGCAPLIGTAAGLIPQCGFSVVAADLYSKRKISLGALIAIFLATTDEAIPIMLSSVVGAEKLWKVVVCVVVVSLVGGYIAFLAEKISRPKKLLEVLADGSGSTEETAVGCHHHKLNHDEEKPQKGFVAFFKKYLAHPLTHTLTVLFYCFIVNLIFGTVLYYVGEEKVTAFISGTGYLQPFVAALVGLIPNCAASVAITQLYVMGGLNLGGAVAGLCCGAGIGFAVLLKENKPLYKSLVIMLGVYLFAALCGLIITLIGF